MLRPFRDRRGSLLVQRLDFAQRQAEMAGPRLDKSEQSLVAVMHESLPQGKRVDRKKYPVNERVPTGGLASLDRLVELFDATEVFERAQFPELVAPHSLAGLRERAQGRVVAELPVQSHQLPSLITCRHAVGLENSRHFEGKHHLRLVLAQKRAQIGGRPDIGDQMGEGRAAQSGEIVRGTEFLAQLRKIDRLDYGVGRKVFLLWHFVWFIPAGGIPARPPSFCGVTLHAGRKNANTKSGSTPPHAQNRPSTRAEGPYTFGHAESFSHRKAETVLSMSPPGRPRWPIHALFFCSGMAGLGYQIVWSRMFAAGLGHEMPSVLAVIGAVMGGMAVGALLGGSRILASAAPGAWYAGLELLIGAWGFATSLLIPEANDVAQQWIGTSPSAFRHWGVGFLLTFATLLPSTAGMGATLPAMERFLKQFGGERNLGAVYAANTLGAMAGALGSAFLLMPELGLRKTTWVFAALNALCALGAYALRAPADPAPQPRGPKRPAPVAPELSVMRLRLMVFGTGLLGIGFEVIGLRLLSQVLENTVYTFAETLAVFLLGTAWGSAWWQSRGREPKPEVSNLLLWIAASCAAGGLVLAHSQEFYDFLRNHFGQGKWGMAMAESMVALAVFAAPSFSMGACFAALFEGLAAAGKGFGVALALNTFGAGCATVLFGVVLAPWCGAKWSLVALVIAYAALAPKYSARRALVAGGAVAVALCLPNPLRLLEIPEKSRVADYREGIMASVAVIEDPARHRSLRVNNRFQMGGTASAVAERRHGHIPILLQGDGRRALFLGLGTGITFEAAGYYEGLQADGVELVPEVLRMLPWFSDTDKVPHREQLRYHLADARRFARAEGEKYDVIVADLFHPAQDGVGLLYSAEHFRAVRNRLAPSGLFCQWLPLHQLDEPMVKVIVRTFLEVFPQASAYLLRFNIDTPVLGLIGTMDIPAYDASWVESRATEPELLKQLRKVTLGDSVRLFGCFLGGADSLKRYSAGAPLNTDDQPVVLFQAPFFSYKKNVPPYGRLLNLIDFFRGEGAKGLSWSAATPPEFVRRVSDFMAARDVYLKGMATEYDGKVTEAVDAYIESARLSQDFTSGYAQCVVIASALAKPNPKAARSILRRLAEAQPGSPVAREMLNRLDSGR